MTHAAAPARVGRDRTAGLDITCGDDGSVAYPTLTSLTHRPARAVAIVIIVVAVPNRTGLLEARLGDRVLCTAREPFFTASRLLLAEGVDPDTTIVMRWRGSNIDALVSTVGTAAAFTVEEGDLRGPRIRRWKPCSLGDVKPPIRATREPLPQALHRETRVHAAPAGVAR